MLARSFTSAFGFSRDRDPPEKGGRGGKGREGEFYVIPFTFSFPVPMVKMRSYNARVSACRYPSAFGSGNILVFFFSPSPPPPFFRRTRAERASNNWNWNFPPFAYPFSFFRVYIFFLFFFFLFFFLHVTRYTIITEKQKSSGTGDRYRRRPVLYTERRNRKGISSE